MLIKIQLVMLTNTEEIKNKLLNILQDGGSPTDTEQYADEFSKWFNFFGTKPTTYSLLKDDTTPTKYSLNYDTTPTTYYLLDDTTLYKYTDKKSQKTYLKNIVRSFDTLALLILYIYIW